MGRTLRDLASFASWLLTPAYHYLSYLIYYMLVTSIMTNIGKTMLVFAVLLMLIAGIAILPETVSAQPNITMGNATGGNMSETNNSTGFIP